MPETRWTMTADIHTSDGVLKIRFTDMPRERMLRAADQSHNNYLLDRGLSVEGDTPSERLIVNWLRHRHTNYDRLQTSEAHRIVCEHIAAAWPWLADECQRQIEARENRSYDLP